MKIKDYDDIKYLAGKKKLKMETDIPKKLGYKSRWGLKLALSNPKKKDKILKAANLMFKN